MVVLHVAKVLRVLTVAPLMALIMLAVLFFRDPVAIGGPGFFAASVGFLTVLPLMAYPLQPVCPHFRGKGREGQRTLAMIFAVLGYILGCGMAFAAKAPEKLRIIFLGYLFSGILVALFNLLHVRASGHACGVTGPFVILALFGQWAGCLGVIPLAVVWWSSLKAKRHTPEQLIAGTILPFFGLAAATVLIRGL